MRITLLLSFLFLLHVASASSIRQAANEYFEAGELTYFSEYFGDLKQVHGNRFFVQSDPEEREGMYFILELEDPDAVASVQIDYIASGKIAPETKVFSLPKTQGKNWIYFGLTGVDWPDSEETVLAWKAVLFNAAGESIGTWKSFLWEKP